MSFAFSIPIQCVAFWSEEPLFLDNYVQFINIAHGAPDVAFVEPMTRRRLGRLARALIHCAARVAPPREHRMVFASRHGDCERTQGLMKEVAEGVSLSPASFSLSVHNATAGQWSLMKGNQGPCSALAAGPDTFAMGLLEAAMAAEQAPDQAVLYAFGEDELPQVHHPFVKDLPPRHATAFLVDAKASCRLELSLNPERRNPEPATQLSIEMVRALAEGRDVSWCGPRGTWSLHAS
ncbi:beta-ketoacyl synthase chain length factor [Holophaga foetida]|uniref:beta-ketoacyl synthase chain length factor n=1 Tax=Holophaga foetida TaxID=35839 RepID=UPI0002471CA5|nr:beta-ketoacyl synthase chain length factor [Holophaga foetida]